MLCPGKKSFFLFDTNGFNDLKGSKGLVFLNLFLCLTSFCSQEKQQDSGALPNNPEVA